MVNATKQDLKNAYQNHKLLATKGNTISHKLLLFYAAECGIKAYYLKINNLLDTATSNLGSTHGHKILKLVRDTSLPGFLLPEPNTDNGNYPLKDLHEHLRYGTSIPASILVSQQQYIQLLVNSLAAHI